MNDLRKLHALDRRNLWVGLNAAVWPYLLFSPLGFGWGLVATALTVLAAAACCFVRNRRRGGCDWRCHLMPLVPGLAYAALALTLHLLS